MEKIGLRFTDVKNGDEVYYYPWLDKESGDHAEPIKTTCRSDAFPIDQKGNGCSEGIFINGMSGYVLMSHLSKDYYPEKISPKKSKSQENYLKYLENDGYYNFSDFLGIERPFYETDYLSGFFRLCSSKYYQVKSAYFRFKKDAKKDYKSKLKEFKNARKSNYHLD